VLVVNPLDFLDREAAELLALEQGRLGLATGFAVFAAATKTCHGITSICLNRSKFGYMQHEHRTVAMPRREEARQFELAARFDRREPVGIVANDHQFERAFDPPCKP